MHCQNLWKSDRVFLVVVVGFLLYQKRRWTFRNCSRSHTALMPESTPSRLQILPTVTTHSRNSSENVIKGDKRCVWSQRLLNGQHGDRRGWELGDTENSLGNFWWFFCLILGKAPETKSEWGVTYVGGGGICYGRKYQGRYYPIPAYYRYTNVTAQKVTFMHQQFHQGWLTCFHFFSWKIFEELVTTFYYLLTNCFTNQIIRKFRLHLIVYNIYSHNYLISNKLWN